MKRIWLHIGVPKSGTSALQRYLMQRSDDLRKQGLAYLVPKGKKSGNDLAVAINRGRDTLSNISADLCAQIDGPGPDQAILSSEMFYGIEPAKLMDALPSLARHDVRVLVYLRRQDRYLESKFIQKAKNGRFKGDIWRYLQKFDGSGADFAAELKPWEATGVTVVPRICEPERLSGGSTVSDMLDLAGLPAPDAGEVAAARENASPGMIRLELMQMLGLTGGFDTKRVQRRIASVAPPAQGAKARFFSLSDRQDLLIKYGPGNEALRARYFAKQNHLFDQTGLDETAAAPDVGFNAEQRTEIALMLATLKEQYAPGD